MTEPALTEDPATGDPVKRLIQPVGISFRGSGFYVNDSRKHGAGSAPKEAPASSADSAPAGKGSTASAPAAD